jgi:flagellar biosynthesis GTPase FlhF
VTTDLELFIVRQDDVEIHAEAIRLKDQALMGGALIGAVTDEVSNEACVEAMKEIKRVLALAEETRQRIKRPVLDLSRMIDCRAKDYCLDLQEELHRLGRACADFQTAQLERVKAQERARQQEIERIEREKQEALRKIEEEERRKAEEARRKAAAEAAAARNEEEQKAAHERAKAEAERLAKEAEAKKKAEEERRAQEQMGVAPVTVPVRAEGQTSKPTWAWEVTDIWLLARMQPGLVNIAPRREQINEVIASMATAGEPKIPGLRIWPEMKVGVRLGRQREAIDV